MLWAAALCPTDRRPGDEGNTCAEMIREMMDQVNMLFAKAQGA